MRARLYGDVSGELLYDDPTGLDPLETDAEDYEDTGSLALSPTLTAAGTKGGVGSASLALVPSPAAAGTKSTGGSGALAVTPSLLAAGTKAASGTASLVLVPRLSATGTSGAPPVPVPVRRRGALPPIWPIEEERRTPIRRSGEGHLVLHAVLVATGHKTWESDDDLAIVLAA